MLETIEKIGPGWLHARLQRLGCCNPDSGLLGIEMTVYAAHLETVPNLGHVEVLASAVQRRVPISEIAVMVVAGSITDGMTGAANTLTTCRH